ncbi:ComF family protein [Pseudothauera rhizosphaerae]|uniref:ComF family protein n=1 Tax=Pseudothauera rhizosphaerae TaxID=2565932 RepID=UPI001E49AEE7|nr:ComF family protein [Pseudothauera rhizosphaerae]
MSNTIALQRLLNHVADLLLPQECFVCGAGSGGEAVCAACRAELPLQPQEAACPVCALPSPGGAVCGRCLREPPAFDTTRALFAYAFPVDRMVQALKYHHRLALARFFADRLLELPPPEGADLLLPMPLHAHRLRERGFNQAAEIARPLAAAWGLPLELATVRREREVPAQAGLDRKARIANLRNAFRCARPLTGLHVVVVDDVMTTGASLNELARTLKAGGAVRVENLIVARTP